MRAGALRIRTLSTNLQPTEEGTQCATNYHPDVTAVVDKIITELDQNDQQISEFAAIQSANKDRMNNNSASLQMILGKNFLEILRCQASIFGSIEGYYRADPQGRTQSAILQTIKQITEESRALRHVGDQEQAQFQLNGDENNKKAAEEQLELRGRIYKSACELRDSIKRYDGTPA